MSKSDDSLIQVAIGASVSGIGPMQFLISDDSLVSGDMEHMTPDDFKLAVAILRDLADLLEKAAERQRCH